MSGEILAKRHGKRFSSLGKYLALGGISKFEYLLPCVRCPVLVIQGENDEYGSEKQVEAISGKSIKKMIPAAKHTPYKENPEMIAEETNRFIRGIAPYIHLFLHRNAICLIFPFGCMMV